MRLSVVLVMVLSLSVVLVLVMLQLSDPVTEFVQDWSSCPSQTVVVVQVRAEVDVQLQVEQGSFGFRAEVCGKLGLVRPTRQILAVW